jgi:hypothetical protein
LATAQANRVFPHPHIAEFVRDKAIYRVADLTGFFGIDCNAHFAAISDFGDPGQIAAQNRYSYGKKVEELVGRAIVVVSTAVLVEDHAYVSGTDVFNYAVVRDGRME